MSSVMRRSRRRRKKKKRKRPLRREDMATVTRQKAKVPPTPRPRVRLRQVRLVGDRVERVLAAAVIGGTTKNIISARHSGEQG
jgi:hypothetical protein